MCHWRVTHYFLSKMDLIEKKRFANVFLERLNGDLALKEENLLTIQYSQKQYKDKGINCDGSLHLTPMY